MFTVKEAKKFKEINLDLLQKLKDEIEEIATHSRDFSHELANA